ncbi:MAG: hypothetical protein ABH872_03360 [Candidatus Omnitrophota bacterium]
MHLRLSASNVFVIDKGSYLGDNSKNLNEAVSFGKRSAAINCGLTQGGTSKTWKKS